jgi:hypothetical protein
MVDDIKTNFAINNERATRQNLFFLALLLRSSVRFFFFFYCESRMRNFYLNSLLRERKLFTPLTSIGDISYSWEEDFVSHFVTQTLPEKNEISSQREGGKKHFTV